MPLRRQRADGMPRHEPLARSLRRAARARRLASGEAAFSSSKAREHWFSAGTVRSDLASRRPRASLTVRDAQHHARRCWAGRARRRPRTTSRSIPKRSKSSSNEEARDPERRRVPHQLPEALRDCSRLHGELLWHVDSGAAARRRRAAVRALRFTKRRPPDGRAEETEACPPCRRTHRTRRNARDRDAQAVGDEPWVPAEREIVDGLQAALKASLVEKRAASVVARSF